MIHLIIKTLDSSDHPFSVNDETTVHQLKEKIRERMNIDLGLQRLIFYGRVLQDDARLADLDVDGKVVHLVQRPPPSPEQRSRVRTRQSSQNGSGGWYNSVDLNRPQSSTGVGVRRMGGNEIMTVTPTAGRMEFIRRLIGEIKGSFASLGACTNISQVNSGASASSRDDSIEQMETEPPAAAPQEEIEAALDENEEVADFSTRALHTRRRNQRANRAVRLRNTRPRDLVLLLDELDRLHTEFAPYRSHYMRLLAGASAGEFTEYTEGQQRETQHVVDLIVDVIHSFAHAYHAISDISFVVDNRNPRLTSDAPNMLRHQFPMQAHINVIHARRQIPNPVSTSTPLTANDTEQHSGTLSDVDTPSPLRFPDANATIGTNANRNVFNRTVALSANSIEENISSISSGSSTPAAQNATEPSESGSSDSDVESRNDNNSGESQTAHRSTSLVSEIRRAYAVGRNTTQPIVNINIQPDPVTYQVEIETRLPIAFTLENSLLSGLVNQSANHQSPQLPQNNTQQNNAEPNNAEPNNAEPNNAEPNNAEPNNAEPNIAEPNNAEPNTAEPNNAQSNNAQQDNAHQEYAQQSTQNRREMFRADIENIMRGLGTHGGNSAAAVGDVEVVMSMEDFNSEFLSDVLDNSTTISGSNNSTGINTVSLESTIIISGSDNATDIDTASMENTPIMTGSNDATGTNTATMENNSSFVANSTLLGNNTYATPHYNTPIRGVQPAEVFITPMQWGSPPDNLLQNIVSSVIRQGMEGVALHTQGQNVQARSNTTQGQTQADNRNNQNNHTQSTGGSQNTQNRPRQFSAAEGAGAIPRVAQPMSMANMIYDRYLACDNLYARRRLLRRRDIHLMQLAAQERVLADRQAVRSLDTLRERFGPLLTRAHMDHINTLLRNDPTPETWLNALLLLLARHIYVNDPMQRRGNEPGMTPVEFHSVRAQLRNYMFNLLRRSGGNPYNAYGPTIDYLLNQYSDFINNMIQGRAREDRSYWVATEQGGTYRRDSEHLLKLKDGDNNSFPSNITPLIPYCNMWGTLRSILHSRMPALVGVVTTNSEGGDLYANRFYLVFTRLFVDICSLVSYHCVNGLDGLRLIYNAFLQQVIQNMNESDRPLFEILAMGNLRAVENDLQANVATIDHHIKRYIPKDKKGGTSGHIQSTAQGSSNVVSQDESNLDEAIAPSGVIPQASSAMEVAPHIPIEELMQTSPAIKKSSEHEMGESTEEAILMSTASSSSSSAKAPVKKAPRKIRVVTTNHPTILPQGQSPSRFSLPGQPEATSSQRSQDQQDLRFAPSPVILLGHWDDEWLPLFTRDHDRQREAFQEPYSDAYLSGMPSRKRRRVREAKPPVTLDAFMDESVREVTERTTPVDNSSVRAALREHMRNIARTRAADSDDYDPREYACAARFLRDASPPPTQEQAAADPSGESPDKLPPPTHEQADSSGESPDKL